MSIESAIQWLESKIDDCEEEIVYDLDKVRSKCGFSESGLHTFRKMRSSDIRCVFCNMVVEADGTDEVRDDAQ